MQTDRRLAAATLEQVLDEPHKAVASSPGVDLATVLKYALAARDRQRIRDLVLALLPFWAVLGLLSDPAVMPIMLALLAAGIFIATWAVLITETLVTYYRVIFPLLRREAFDPADAPEPRSPHDRARLAEIAASDRGNVVVSASYRPFPGYGGELETWSVTLNMAKAEEGESVIPFQVHELYDHVGDAIGGLGLPGVSVEDRLVVNGRDLLRGLDPQVRRAVLPDPLGTPVLDIDDALMRRLRDDLIGHARPYLTVFVAGWNGELVVTIFLRLALLPGRDLLFVEASYLLLPPSRDRYRKVDGLLGHPTGRQLSNIACESFVRSFLAVPQGLAATLSLLRGPWNGWTKARRDRRAILFDRTFNYGTEFSVRERSNDNSYFRYFQKLDQELYVKTVERRIFDAITDFMERHNIDTSDFSQRQMTILNNGVFVTGQGRVDAQNIAAGKGSAAGAAARQNQPQPQAR
ncbi:hypothetical protein [Spirillospora sp. NPDC047279]|uniref:hypothetical protein n=1 Tax=Spirillospora sp. NPDC047279 TaxID=3155478 RepID=UPI0033EA9302